MSTSFHNALLKELTQLPRDGGIYRVYHFVTNPVLCTYPIELSGVGTFSRQSNMIHRLVVIAHEISNEKPAFVCGLEAMEYKKLSTDANPSLAYVSKVDTTGYKAPAPLASLLVKTYLSSLSDCTIHIFARAQPQYLFPKSVQNTQKRIQSDRGLIAWWLRTISDTSFLKKLDAWWCIPGVDDQQNAKREISITQDLKSGHVNWNYGYPYDDNANPNTVIPKFPDDAKSRLLKSYAEYDKKDYSDEEDDDDEREEEEEVEDAENGDDSEADGQDLEETSSHGTSGEDGEIASKEDDSKIKKKSRRKLQDLLDNNEPNTMTVREFWQLLSISEECGSGKLTGFFVINGIPKAEEDQNRPKEMAQAVTNDQFTIIWNRLMAFDFVSDEINRQSTAKITAAIVDCLKEVTDYAPVVVIPDGSPENGKLKRPMQQETPSAPTVNVLGGSFIKRKRT